MRRLIYIGAVALAMAGITGVSAAPLAVSSWAPQSTPNPTGNMYSELNGVSCPSATLCLAVGDNDNASGTTVTLAERWRAGAWSITSTPVPSGATSSALGGVSCPSTTVCIAVGNYISGGGPTRPLAERWNGSTWTLQSVTGPTGMAALSGVSCTSVTVCTAVGDWAPSDLASIMTLAERWNGTTWTVQSTPNPPSYSLAGLSGVSCPAATTCTAVGHYLNTEETANFVLAERWNGSTWSLQTLPHPAGVTSSSLNGVSCSSAALCTSVGDMERGGVVLTRAERWNGTVWALQTSPNPAHAISSDLNGVSCPAANDCTAVGEYTTSPDVGSAFAERWSGGTWLVQSVPPPSGATQSALQGVPAHPPPCVRRWDRLAEARSRPLQNGIPERAIDFTRSR